MVAKRVVLRLFNILLLILVNFICLFVEMSNDFIVIIMGLNHTQENLLPRRSICIYNERGIEDSAITYVCISFAKHIGLRAYYISETEALCIYHIYNIMYKQKRGIVTEITMPRYKTLFLAGVSYLFIYTLPLRMNKPFSGT